MMVENARTPAAEPMPRSSWIGWCLPLMALAGAMGSACSDDQGGGGASSTSVTSTTGATGGASGTATGATTSQTSSSSGAGGNMPIVNPIEGAAPVSLVQDGFVFLEGPCWFAGLGALRFSDQGTSIIHDLTGSTITDWRTNSGNSNGLAITPDGKLVDCEVQNRRVSVSDPGAPAFTLIVDKYLGKKLNAPNDVIVRSDKTIYFTDPDYGLAAADHEIGFNGVYRVSPTGDIDLIASALVLPNGIALSPDETKLYVNDEGDAAIYRFDVHPDGSADNGMKLITTTPHPDGMGVDDAGNLYLATQAGVDVYKPDGTSWGNIAVPQQPSNVSFGGSDRQTLYITARTGLYSVHLNVPGKP